MLSSTMVASAVVLAASYSGKASPSSADGNLLRYALTAASSGYVSPRSSAGTARCMAAALAGLGRTGRSASRARPTGGS